MFGFPFFATFASQSSSIPFAWSLHAPLLILVHLWHFGSRRCCGYLRCESYLIVLPVMHLKVLVSVVLDRHLVMLVSAPFQ
jgi:hypothetical protein